MGKLKQLHIDCEKGNCVTDDPDCYAQSDDV